MKRIMKKAIALALAAVLLLAAAGAAADEWKPADPNVRRFRKLMDMLNESREKLRLDTVRLDKLITAMGEESPADGAIAAAIADHWKAVVLDESYAMYLWDGEEERASALEESGLDFSGKHAFVVLGFQLADGEMAEELIGRCDAAAAAARSYPDAVLVCTGGATGQNNPEGHTEAGLMKEYLVEKHGIDPDRIYTETEAMITLDNAANTFRMLEEMGIGTYTVITSNYHQRWGQILFNAVAAIQEAETGYKAVLVGNYSYIARPDVPATSGTRTALMQLSSLLDKRSGKTK